MKIGGFQKFSLIDYPDHVAAVIFTQGCNLRCPFCHNPELIAPEGNIEYNWDNILEFLQTRINLLDSVVITGGEPTLQPDLISVVSHLKLLGFKVKLDTNGSRPDVLADLIQQARPDYIAMDIKADPEGYAQATNSRFPFTAFRKSINLILESNIPYEFRTTVLPDFQKDHIHSIARYIRGASQYILQNLSGFKTLDHRFEHNTLHPEEIMTCFRDTASDYVQQCFIR